MNKMVLSWLLSVHTAIMLFYLYSIFQINVYDNAFNQLIIIFALTSIFCLSSFLVLIYPKKIIYSLLPYVLLIGVLDWYGWFRFCGVYAFTFLGSILIHIEDQKKLSQRNQVGSDSR